MSPCIRHCKLNNSGVCLGCGRTVQEITKWRNMTEEEKQQTVRRCEERIRENNGNKEV